MPARSTKLSPSSSALAQSRPRESEGAAEIDENLIRRDLTAVLRAKLVAERKAAYEAVYPETKHGKAPVGRGGRKESAK
jgi:hypothetical protein